MDRQQACSEKLMIPYYFQLSNRLGSFEFSVLANLPPKTIKTLMNKPSLCTGFQT